jgi:hypothetical protein
MADQGEDPGGSQGAIADKRAGFLDQNALQF